jgi:hypothetical protein
MTSSSPVPICIKWGKHTYDVQMSVDTANGIATLKQQLEELTGVPNDRMKLMAKSKGGWVGDCKVIGWMMNGMQLIGTCLP